MTLNADYRRRLADVPGDTFVPIMAGDFLAVLDAAEALAAAAREVVGYGMDARLDDAFDLWAKVTRDTP